MLLVLNTKYDKLNPLQPIGDPRAWLGHLTDTYKHGDYPHLQTRLTMMESIEKLYRRYDVFDKGRIYPSMLNLKEFLLEEANKPSTPAAKRNKIYTCLEPIYSLLTNLNDMLDCSSGYTQSTLSDFPCVSFEMSGLSSTHQAFLTKLRLKDIHNWCLSDNVRHVLKIVTCFEEASTLFGKRLHERNTNIDFMQKFITQSRSAGNGSLNITQNMLDVANFVVQNTSCHIHFSQTAQKNPKSTGFSLGCFTEEQIRESQSLKLGEALISFTGFSPFLLRARKSPVQGHISDEEIEELMKPIIATLPYTPSQQPQSPRIELIETKKERENENKEKSLESLLTEMREFLITIKNFPELNITQVYASLNLSGRKGNKLKNQLLNNRLIEEETMNSGIRGRSPKKIRMTQKGEKMLLWLEKRKEKAEGNTDIFKDH